MAEIFKPGLEPYGDFPDLLAGPSGDGPIIRRVGTAHGESWETAKQSRDLHAELTDKFHIPVVPYSVVIDSDASFCCIAERVDGRSIEDVNGKRRRGPVTKADLTYEQYLSAQHLHERQYDYLKHKIGDREPFLSDIFALNQFLYTWDGNWVLVDIEPYICPTDAATNPIMRLQEETLAYVEYAESVTHLFMQDTALSASWKVKLESLMKVIFAASGMDAESTNVQRAVELATDTDYLNAQDKMWFDETEMWKLVFGEYLTTNKV